MSDGSDDDEAPEATGVDEEVTDASADGAAAVWDDQLQIICDSFEGLELRDELLRGVFAHGFPEPTKIQQRAIAPCIKGQDVIVQAQSGTGKTAAFVIAILQNLDTSVRDAQALVLVPTREMVQQIQKLVLSLGDYMGVKCHACIGGTSVRGDIAQLRSGPHVVVGTPGRVLDMVSRGPLRTRRLRTLVLAGADRMLGGGLRRQIWDLIHMLPRRIQLVQTCGVPAEVAVEFAGRLRRSPIGISIPSKDGEQADRPLDGVRQFYIDVAREDSKLDAVCNLCEKCLDSQAQVVVFCSTKRKVDWLAQAMLAKEFTVGAFHGDLARSERQSVLDEFRSGSVSVLLGTDLLVGAVTGHQRPVMIVNYDLPTISEAYPRRLSLCSGFSQRGIAVSLVTAGQDKDTLKFLETHCNASIEEMPADVASLI